MTAFWLIIQQDKKQKPKVDGRPAGHTDGQTYGLSDNVKTVYRCPSRTKQFAGV